MCAEVPAHVSEGASKSGPTLNSVSKLAVGIPTTGRPDTLRRTIELVRNQSRPPDKIVIAPISENDVSGLDRDIPNLEIVFGPAGLSRQRNTILRRTKGLDILTFFDDDFFPCNDYLAVTEKFFQEHPNAIVMTGKVIADGVNGPGLKEEEAEMLLATHQNNHGQEESLIKPKYNGYGCNMSIHLRSLTCQEITFDENLPQYSWLEDLDYSRQLAPFGDILYFAGAQGVHLGEKKGRQAGIKLGYSQVANVIYLVRKGTCKRSLALRIMGGNIAMNIARSLAPEPHIDRAGRLRGNLKAFVDTLCGRVDPRNIEHM